MKSILLMLSSLLLLMGTADAQVLFRCVSAKGAVSWQSVPCSQGMRMMRSIAYTPEVPTAVAASIHQQTKPETKPETKPRYRSGYRVSTRARTPKPDACAKERVHREATLERVGLKRNYDLLSKLDADVRRVCR